MNCNFIGTTYTHSNLGYQTKFRLNEVNKMKDYFNWEIKEKKWLKNWVNILLLLIIMRRL